MNSLLDIFIKYDINKNKYRIQVFTGDSEETNEMLFEYNTFSLNLDKVANMINPSVMTFKELSDIYYGVNNKKLYLVLEGRITESLRDEIIKLEPEAEKHIWSDEDEE